MPCGPRLSLLLERTSLAHTPFGSLHHRLDHGGGGCVI